jgi:hypothetical protein
MKTGFRIEMIRMSSHFDDMSLLSGIPANALAVAQALPVFPLTAFRRDLGTNRRNTCISFFRLRHVNKEPVMLVNTLLLGLGATLFLSLLALCPPKTSAPQTGERVSGEW